MKVLTIALLLVIITIASSMGTQAAIDASDLTVKDNLSGLPLNVSAIETAPGPWMEEWQEDKHLGGLVEWGEYNIFGIQPTVKYHRHIQSIVFIRLRPERVVNAADINLSLEYKDAIGQRQEKTIVNHTWTNDGISLYDALAPIFPQKGDLLPDSEYYASFPFPRNLSSGDYEFNHVIVKVGNVTGDLGIDDAHGKGSFRGIKAGDGHLVLVKTNSTWMITNPALIRKFKFPW